MSGKSSRISTIGTTQKSIIKYENLENRQV